MCVGQVRGISVRRASALLPKVVINIYRTLNITINIKTCQTPFYCRYLLIYHLEPGFRGIQVGRLCYDVLSQGEAVVKIGESNVWIYA